MESILTSIKKLLGIVEECNDFDIDIIMHINSAFFDLVQMGVGPKDGFSIQDDLSKWSDFLEDATKYESVKTYVFLKVKTVFDPPASATVLEAYNRRIAECEWRLNVQAESGGVVNDT